MKEAHRAAAPATTQPVHVVSVGFEEIDFARVAFYGHYFSWIERAMEQWFHAKGLYYRELVGEREIGVPIVEAHCRYTAPVQVEDVLEIRLAVREVTRRGFRVEFDMTRQSDGLRVADGHLLRRFVQFGRPIEIPDDLLGLFEEMERESGKGT
jgi:acyl-CoA thioester hydrolase